MGVDLKKLQGLINQLEELQKEEEKENKKSSNTIDNTTTNNTIDTQNSTIE